MTLGFGRAFVRDALPDDFACLTVETVNLPGVLRYVVRRLHVTVKSVPERLRIARNRGGDKDAIAPDDGTAVPQPGNLSLPGEIRLLLGVEGCRWIGSIGNSLCLDSAELRPVLAEHHRAGE